jgi:hypothetical protein
MIICRGVGLEPQIVIGQMHGEVFEPTTSIVFNPILTHSLGDEQEIVIRNPCTFPIEIYNLEFDKQYLEEEKVKIESKNTRINQVFPFRFFVFYQAMMKIITFFYQLDLQAINYQPNYKNFMKVNISL